MVDASLTIRVDSRQVRGADTNLDSMAGAARRAERATDGLSDSSRRGERATSGLSSSLKTAAKAALVLAAALGAREIVEYTDRMTNVNNKLKLVTDSTEELTTATQDLRTVARDTRTGFESTVGLYVKLARSSKELGLSQDRLLGITSTINKAFAISGTTAAEASAAILQLGQALASGVLRGDEFNTIAEAAPEILRAIAKHTGLATGALRDFAATGGITAKIVVDSLEAASKVIGEEFAKSTATFAQSMQIADDILLEFVGSSELAKSVVGGLGEAIVGITDALPEIEAFITSWVAQFDILGQDIGITLDIISGEFGESTGEWGEDVENFINFFTEAFTFLPINIRALIQLITVEFATLISEAELTAGKIKDALSVFGDIDLKVSEDTKSQFTELADTVVGFFSDLSLFSDATLGVDEFVEGFSVLGNVFSDLGNSAVSEAEKVGEGLSKISDELSQGLEDINENRIDSISSIIDEAELQKASFTARVKESKTLLASKIADQKALRERLKALQGLTSTYQAAGKSAAKLAKENAKFEKSFQSIQDKIDPVGASLRKLGADIAIVQEAIFRGFDKDLGVALIASLNDAANEMESSFQGSIDSIANSLQDAIVSGDWEGIGATIGGVLASSIAKMTGEAISESLAGQAFASSILGPLAGALAGGVVGIAVGALTGLFSSSKKAPVEFDLEGQQSAEGTGTIFGDTSEQTHSIVKAVEITANATAELVGINTNMLSALDGTNAAITDTIKSLAIDLIRSPILPTESVRQEILTGRGFDVTNNKQFEIISEELRLPVGFFDSIVSDLGDTLTGARVALVGQSSELFFDVSQESNEFIKNSLMGIRDTIKTGVMDIGISGQEFENAISKISFDDLTFTTKDLSPEELSAQFETIFSGVFDTIAKAASPLLSGVEGLAIIGEGAGETLIRLVSQLGEVQEAAIIFGVSLDGIPIETLVRVSDELVNLVGGVGAFNKAIIGFERNFLSAEEQLTNQARRLNSALSEIGETLPETSQGFRELAKEFAGSPEDLALILKVSGAASSYYNDLVRFNEKAADSVDDLGDAVDNTAELMEMFAKSLAKGQDQALDRLKKSVDAEKAIMKESFDSANAERKKAASDEITGIKTSGDNRNAAIKSTEDIRLTANNLALNAAKDGLRAITTEARGLASALDKLNQVSTSNEARRSEALSTLRGAISSGDLSGTGVAAGVAAGIKQADFASAEDFNRQVGVTRGIIAQLKESGTEQKTVAEQTVDLLTDQTRQIKDNATNSIRASESLTDQSIQAAEDRLERDLGIAETQFNEEIARLDLIISNAELQLDTLRNIDNSILSVVDAVNAFNSLVPEPVRSPTFVPAGEKVTGTANLLRLFGASLDRAAQEDAVKVPGFANGGSFGGGLRMVGERGPELEMTGSSRIISNNDLRDMLGNAELNEKIEKLNNAMMSVARNTMKIAKRVDRWEGDGLPNFRETQDVSVV